MPRVRWRPHGHRHLTASGCPVARHCSVTTSASRLKEDIRRRKGRSVELAERGLRRVPGPRRTASSGDRWLRCHCRHRTLTLVSPYVLRTIHWAMPTTIRLRSAGGIARMTRFRKRGELGNGPIGGVLAGPCGDQMIGRPFETKKAEDCRKRRQPDSPFPQSGWMQPGLVELEPHR